ncbi:hypothetical protein [Methylobacterium sp. WL6]|uniref:hypothetical protein n=1 Tax=Methylobacterium sp. WL6 TaxID=2603901 RepID=UPI0011CA46C0|nr:hypothetical protein [Methylobacterium sp. WL6]TXN65122.1 hypothetical protein FV230_17320 [Methylobacterium sp. WL6]
MPSLKLSNPFRRSADRPSLRDRAAALRATAARVMGEAKPLTSVKATDDAVLVALGREFEAAVTEAAAAEEACSKVTARAGAFPEPSACLVFREVDYPFGLRRMSCHPSALEGLPITHEDIDWMRRGPRRRQVLREARPGEHGWRDYGGKVPEMQPWLEAQARADEILEAWDAWQAAQVAHDAEHGVIEAEARAETAHAKVGDLLDQMTALPARTAEGLCVKLWTIRFGVECMGDHQTGRFLRALVQDAADMQAQPLSQTPSDMASVSAPSPSELNAATKA